MIENLIQQVIVTSHWEWLAVVLAVFYIFLAIKESVWCWPAAFLSTAIYAVLFFDVSLYMESILNAYYLLMAVYGWYQWSFVKSNESTKPIVRWSLKSHLLLSVSLCGVVLVSGFLLEKYTDQDFAYLDSFTTWFAIVATYMMAKKVLEHWIYWVVIDAFSIYLYLNKGFALTALLFAVYTFMAITGWIQWKKHFENSNPT
ncbi:nicotinamide riboside transporter PnuC [Aliikangiella sp. IMCC44653]